MAQIKNMNMTPVVSPEDAYIIALKGGQLSRIESKSLMGNNDLLAKAEAATKAAIAAVVEAQTKKIDELSATVAQLKELITKFEASQTSAVSTIENTQETLEETTKKTNKKTAKKSAE